MTQPDPAALALFPAILQRIVDSVPEGLWRQRASDESFALVEQAWHLADLEAEAYAVRIARLLAEENPSFADFAGDVMARERRYLELDLRTGLAKYAATRTANRERLLRVQPDEWQRRGTQENAGGITLAGVAASMLGHDRAHANELLTLLPELGVAAPEELASFARQDTPPLAE